MSINHEIVVKIANVYGNETIYPLCAQAKLFAQIAGTKTLNRSVLSSIRALGYTIHVSQAGAICRACELNAA